MLFSGMLFQQMNIKQKIIRYSTELNNVKVCICGTSWSVFKQHSFSVFFFYCFFSFLCSTHSKNCYWHQSWFKSVISIIFSIAWHIFLLIFLMLNSVFMNQSNQHIIPFCLFFKYFKMYFIWTFKWNML